MKKNIKTRFRLFNAKYSFNSVRDELANREYLKTNFTALDELDAALITAKYCCEGCLPCFIDSYKITQQRQINLNSWIVGLTLTIIAEFDHDDVRVWDFEFLIEEI